MKVKPADLLFQFKEMVVWKGKEKNKNSFNKAPYTLCVAKVTKSTIKKTRGHYVIMICKVTLVGFLLNFEFVSFF